MFYVYRGRPSTSARDLADALGGRRLRSNNLGVLRRGDVVVCWGSHLALPEGVRSINNKPVGNKLNDVALLQQAGVPTITISRTRPTVAAAVAAVPAQPAQPAVDPFLTMLGQQRTLLLNFAQMQGRPTNVQMAQFRDAAVNLANAFDQPVIPARAAVAAVPARQPEEWVGRIVDHIGGLDLLTPPRNPEFWVKKEPIVNEFRVHSFQGRSIRSAVKVHRDDANWQGEPSAWVRSWDGGWKMAYREGAVRQAHRDIAHKAVAALGLDFGAVDIGEKADGSLVVLEVNRAPGVSEGSAEIYARAIERWATAA